jgi:dTDP-4-amino-4,6-dideoxygalactose transaminase
MGNRSSPLGRMQSETPDLRKVRYTMFTSFKNHLKAFCFDTKNRPIRLALDQVLKYRAASRIALTDHSRVHAGICVPLQLEMGRVLGLSSEFEIELYVRRFEADFAQLCKRRFAVGTHSGTSALQLSLVALNIGPGDEVITVPNTYIATALAISNTGAKPVFVDIEDATFNMDPSRLAAAITPRTKAIIPVHLYGQMANMPEIMKIAASHELKVIEDACQAFGAERYGRKAGSVGHVGCFSFSTAKNLGGFGNGGMVVSDDKSLIEKIRSLRNPESNAPELSLSRRTPCYLDAVQIAFIRAKLPFMKKWDQARRDHANYYRKALNAVDIALPAEAEGARHSYYRFAVRSIHRKGLSRWLNQAGIRTAPSFTPLHVTPTYSGLGYARGAFPQTEAAAHDTLLLPISPFLQESERARVSESICNFHASLS